MKVKCLALSFIISFLFQIHFSFSQRENTYHIESAAIIGTEQTPFWMRANQWGAVPTKGQTISIFTGVKSDYFQNKKPIQIGYGLNLGGFVGLENKAIIQEGYVKAKWKVFEAYAGRRKEIVGLVDSTISSGSYIWSGNALPLPKIEISIPEYTSFRKNGFFALKGNFAHGWFDRNRSDSKGLKLHQKSLYLRFGQPNYKLKLYVGLNHQAQWGGKVQYDDSLGRYSKGGRFGSTLSDYLYVVSGRSAVGGDTSQFSGANELLNRVGNHLGTIDLGVEINLRDGKLFFYRQSIFEDGSLFYLNNITDGLNGISWSIEKTSNSPLNIKKIVFEYLNTLSQGGPFYDNPNVPNIRGSDNYYNNSQFIDGWSYQKYSIGTPFILSQVQYPLAFKPKDVKLMFSNTRIQAFYFGTNININNFNLGIRYSISKNWGSYQYAPTNPLFQQSILFSGNTFLKNVWGGIGLSASMSTDYGDFFDGNFGIKFGVRKDFSVFPFGRPNPTHKHQF